MSPQQASHAPPAKTLARAQVLGRSSLEISDLLRLLISVFVCRRQFVLGLTPAFLLLAFAL